MRVKFNNLRNRFVLYFLVISMVPAGIVGIVTYSMATQMIIEQKVNDTANKMEKVMGEVNEKVNEKETLGIKFYLNENVQDLLVQGNENLENNFRVMQLLFSNEYTDVNDAIFLESESGKIYTNSMISDKDAEELLNHGKEALEHTDDYYAWLDYKDKDGEKNIFFIREIHDLYNTDDSNRGYFMTGIQEHVLQDIYDSYFDDDKKNIYIIQNDKQVMSNENTELIGTDFSDVFQSSLKKTESASYYKTANYYAVAIKDVKRDWTYLYMLKRETALGGMQIVRFVPLIGMILSFVVSIMMSIIASSQIIKPIKVLTNKMQQVEKGDMSIRFQVPDIKEIAELGMFFNKMIEKLQDSMRQIYEVQRQRRDAEMKALVLQINPHFLYNTLSSIIWLTDADKKEEVMEMTNSLATLFRISISKGQEIVRIREEFEHVKSYIRIQQIRFENKFTCYVELDEEIADCYTPKVILQPLVENFVNHALADIDYQGTVLIRGEKSKKNILLSVIDNANGMTEEEVNELNAHLKESYETGKVYGIGTSNVNNRIKMVFGKKYGLKFRKEDMYIIAEIKIPAIYDENELEYK